MNNVARTLKAILIIISLSSILSLSDGIGYSSKKRDFSSINCFNIKSKYGNYESNIELEGDASLKKIDDLLNPKINLGAKLFGVDVGFYVKVDIIKEKSDSSKTINLYYINQIKRSRIFDIDDIGEGLLNNNGKELFKKGEFRENCGDYVITSLLETAFLVITVELTFEDSLVKDEVVPLIGTNIPLFQISLKLDFLKESLKKKFKLKINTHQQGGIATDLTTIIDSESFSKCGFDNLKQCDVVLKNLFKYATVDFINQLDNDNSMTVPNPLFGTYMSIENFLLTNKNGNLSEKAKTGLKMFLNLKEKTDKAMEMINSYSEDVKEKILFNKSLFEEGNNNYYMYYAKCVYEKQEDCYDLALRFAKIYKKI